MNTILVPPYIPLPSSLSLSLDIMTFILLSFSPTYSLYTHGIIEKSTMTKTAAPSQQLNLMSSTDIDRILADATACVEGECALDDVSALLSNLLAQQSLLSSRINEIDKLVSSLESSNGVGSSGAERPVDEMRETVRAIFRIFSVGVSFILSLVVAVAVVVALVVVLVVMRCN